jgi:hypothetical protein
MTLTNPQTTPAISTDTAGSTVPRLALLHHQREVYLSGHGAAGARQLHDVGAGSYVVNAWCGGVVPPPVPEDKFVN